MFSVIFLLMDFTVAVEKSEVTGDYYFKRILKSLLLLFLRLDLLFRYSVI